MHYSKVQSNTNTLFLKKRLNWNPIIHLEVSEENLFRKTNRCALCEGYTFQPWLLHNIACIYSRKMHVFIYRWPLEHSRILWLASSCWHRGNKGPRSPRLYLQHWVDALPTFSSLCPGSCPVPYQPFRRGCHCFGMPLAFSPSASMHPMLPHTCPPHMPISCRVPKATMSHCSAHPEMLLREEDELFLLWFCFNEPKVPFPAELKKWKTLYDLSREDSLGGAFLFF